MEIISRSEAIARQLTQYFTGQECKNHHIAYRYTRSGACSACVASANGPVQDQLKRKELRAKLGELVAFRARCFHEDLPFFRSIVLATVQAREPQAQLSDIWRPQAGKLHACGTAVFTFNCFGLDVAQLQATAQGIFDARNNKLPMRPVPKPYQPPAEEWPEGDPT